jgi:cell division protein FtsB
MSFKKMRLWKFLKTICAVLSLCFFVAAFSACVNSDNALENLRQQVEQLQERVSELENENGQLKDRIGELEEEIETLTNPPGKEWALEGENIFGPYGPLAYIRYWSDKTEFGLDEVTLAFTYSLASPPHPETEWIEFYFWSERGDYDFIDSGDIVELPPFKTVLPHAFWSAELWGAGHKFSETLTAPRELFIGESGVARICIAGLCESGLGDQFRPGVWMVHIDYVPIYYIINGGKVTLYSDMTVWGQALAALNPQ